MNRIDLFAILLAHNLSLTKWVDLSLTCAEIYI